MVVNEALAKPLTADVKPKTRSRRANYEKQRWKMQRFKFRLPNNTRQVNLENLNDYHLHLRDNPGIDTSSFVLYDMPRTSPLGTAAYRLSGRARQSLAHSVGALSPNSFLPVTPAVTPDSSPFKPSAAKYELYQFLSEEINCQPSSDLPVYKKLMGSRDLAKEASVDMAHEASIAKNTLACRSTNYTQFRGLKMNMKRTHLLCHSPPPATKCSISTKQ